MKANELRIGNKIQDLNGHIETVVKIHNPRGEDISPFFNEKDSDLMNPDENMNIMYYEINDISIHDFMPITLTEELLVKCGFEYSKRASCFYIGENPVTNDWMLVLKYLPDTGYFYRYGFIQIKYLHQLQNLYFDLTGNELDIKL